MSHRTNVLKNDEMLEIITPSQITMFRMMDAPTTSATS